MKNSTIKTFYTPKMALKVPVNFSWSPNKPRMLMKHLEEAGLRRFFHVDGGFKPFDRPDFYIAHEPGYVNGFFKGNERATGNGLTWTPEFRETVRYTNSSLYHAIKAAVLKPQQVTFSPTSGFHHAHPWGGGGFCTFSGQVIASTKIYRQYGLVGAYLDLDGHYGNSIEDARDYVEDLNHAIPRDCNINPKRSGRAYLKDLRKQLHHLGKKIAAGRVDYVVWCHGADSHNTDDMRGDLNTSQWLAAARMFYKWVLKTEAKVGKQIPVTLSLFGGYRQDDYKSVLALHTADLVICLRTLSGWQDLDPEDFIDRKALSINIWEEQRKLWETQKRDYLERTIPFEDSYE